MKGVLQGLVCKSPEPTLGDAAASDSRIGRRRPGTTKPARTGHGPPPPVLGFSAARESTEKFSSLLTTLPSRGVSKGGLCAKSICSDFSAPLPRPVHPGTAGQGRGLGLRGKECLQTSWKKREKSGARR